MKLLCVTFIAVLIGRIGKFLKSLFCFLLRKYLRKIFNEQRASLKAITIFPAEQQDVRKNISFLDLVMDRVD